MDCPKPTPEPGAATNSGVLTEMSSPSDGRQLQKRLTWMSHRRDQYGDLIEQYAAMPGSVPIPDPWRGSIREWKDASKAWQFALVEAMQILADPIPIASQMGALALPPGVYEQPQVMALLLRPPPYPPPERVGNSIGRALFHSAASRPTRFQQAFYRRALAMPSSG